MPLETGLIAYAAIAHLAVARKKYRPAPRTPAVPSPLLARAIGLTLLALSLLAAIVRYGGPQGVVAWTGQTCIAGAAFVLILSWRSSVAFLLGMAALLCTVPIMLL